MAKLALAGLFMLLASVPAAAQVRYTVTDLGAFWVCDINNHGQVVGAALNSEGVSRAFLFSQGSMTELGTLGGESVARGINNAGQVVGECSEGGAFLYQDGCMRGLGAQVGGYRSYAVAINGAGQVVGYSLEMEPDIYTYSWQYRNGTVIRVSTGAYTEVTDINEVGDVVGDCLYDGPRAFMWNAGTMTILGRLGRGAWASAVNDNGQVVGSSTTEDWAECACLWADGDVSNLGSLASSSDYGTWSRAWDVNNLCQIVGESYTGDVGPNEYHAVLWEDGAIVDLNTVIDPASGWTLQRARANNDNGQIVGWGISPSGLSHSFLLNPIPEPASMGLVAASLVGLLLRRRRP
jgi:probable HAF family extracellular repeat protein